MKSSVVQLKLDLEFPIKKKMIKGFNQIIKPPVARIHRSHTQLFKQASSTWKKNRGR